VEKLARRREREATVCNATHDLTTSASKMRRSRSGMAQRSATACLSACSSSTLPSAATRSQRVRMRARLGAGSAAGGGWGSAARAEWERSSRAGESIGGAGRGAARGRAVCGYIHEPHRASKRPSRTTAGG